MKITKTQTLEYSNNGNVLIFSLDELGRKISISKCRGKEICQREGNESFTVSVNEMRDICKNVLSATEHLDHRPGSTVGGRPIETL